jgi:small subunit ribosomal protein S20
MAKHSSAEKAHRRSERKFVYNLRVKRNIKELVKTARELIKNKKEKEAREAVAKAVKYLNKSVTQNVLHRNNASRRISRLVILLNKSFTPAKN